MITHETKLWPDLDSQQRIFIWVEGVAPQGRGSEGNKSWRMFVIIL